uniref:Uncharacterized protein n=1 Tax=Helianthus annuus TaxID=4232 RepID=A0A251RZ89_HELAN
MSDSSTGLSLPTCSSISSWAVFNVTTYCRKTGFSILFYLLITTSKIYRHIHCGALELPEKKNELRNTPVSLSHRPNQTQGEP